MRFGILLISLIFISSLSAETGWPYGRASSVESLRAISKSNVIAGRLVVRSRPKRGKVINRSEAGVRTRVDKALNSALGSDRNSYSLTAKGSVTVSNGVKKASHYLVQFSNLTGSNDERRQRTDQIMAQLNATSDLQAEPDYYTFSSASKNDTYFPPTVGAWGQSYENLWGLTKVNASAAWEKTEGGALVAVIDTGVDYNHPELNGQVLLGPDLVDGDSHPEILFTVISSRAGWGGGYGIHAFDYLGRSVTGFPKLAATGWPGVGAPTVAEIDGDGIPDILWSDGIGNVYAWSGTSKTTNRPWPTYMADSQSTGAAPLSVIKSPWQNPDNRKDVNKDGYVTPQDLLVLYNAYSRLSVGKLPTIRPEEEYCVDVNGDGYLTAFDVQSWGR